MMTLTLPREACISVKIYFPGGATVYRLRQLRLQPVGAKVSQQSLCNYSYGQERETEVPHCRFKHLNFKSAYFNFKNPSERAAVAISVCYLIFQRDFDSDSLGLFCKCATGTSGRLLSLDTKTN